MPSPSERVAQLKRDLQRSVDETIQGFLEIVDNKAMQRLEPHFMHGTIAASMRIERDGPFTGTLIYDAPHAAPAEKGSHPDFIPPLERIEEWVTVRGIATVDGEGNLMSSRDTAWLIARAIQERGSQGIHYLQGAVDEMEPNLLEDLVESFRLNTRGRGA